MICYGPEAEVHTRYYPYEGGFETIYERGGFMALASGKKLINQSSSFQ